MIVSPLAAQNERDTFNGFNRYLAAKHRQWSLQILRNGLSASALQGALDQQFDGIVFNYPTADRHIINLLHASNVPMVMVDFARRTSFDNRRAPTGFVMADDVLIGERAADYLREQNDYASFAYIGFKDGRLWSKVRGESFVRRLKSVGLSSRIANLDSQTGINLLPRPAAVFVANDDLAYDVITSATHQGLRIPKDLAVLGVDNDLVFCCNSHPTMSSIHPDFEYAGFLAGEMIDRILQNKDFKPQRAYGISEIFARESTAIANRNGKIVQRIDEIINRDFATIDSIAKIARDLNASRRLIDLRYRQVKGISIHDAILNRRLERVKVLLKETSLSTDEIAANCGFSSETYLMRVFRQHYGITLRNYRIG